MHINSVTFLPCVWSLLVQGQLEFLSPPPVPQHVPLQTQTASKLSVTHKQRLCLVGRHMRRCNIMGKWPFHTSDWPSPIFLITLSYSKACLFHKGLGKTFSFNVGINVSCMCFVTNCSMRLKLKASYSMMSGHMYVYLASEL